MNSQTELNRVSVIWFFHFSVCHLSIYNRRFVIYIKCWQTKDIKCTNKTKRPTEDIEGPNTDEWTIWIPTASGEKSRAHNEKWQENESRDPKTYKIVKEIPKPYYVFKCSAYGTDGNNDESNKKKCWISYSYSILGWVCNFQLLVAFSVFEMFPQKHVTVNAFVTYTKLVRNWAKI